MNYFRVDDWDATGKERIGIFRPSIASVLRRGPSPIWYNGTFNSTAITISRRPWDTTPACYYLTGAGDYTNGKLYTPNTTLTLNTWHHIEAYFQMNTISASKGQKDGIMWMSVDGTQVNELHRPHLSNKSACYNELEPIYFGAVYRRWLYHRSVFLDDLIVATPGPPQISSALRCQQICMCIR